MARAAETKTVEIDPLVLAALKEISSLKQDAADANMAVASAYKAHGDKGIDTDALKMVVKTNKMDAVKAQGIIEHFIAYLIAQGTLTPETNIVFRQTSLKLVQPDA